MIQREREKADAGNTGGTGRRDDSNLRCEQFGKRIRELQRAIPHLDVQIAHERAELTSAFEMLHTHYVRRGYIKTHSGGIMYREAFGHPESRTLVAIDTAHGELAGTLSIIGDEAEDMPVRAIYADQLDALNEAGRQVAEVSSLVICPLSRQRSALTLFRLTQFAVQYLRWRQYDDIIFVVHPRHQAYYSRWVGVETLGAGRPHPLVGSSPGSACRLDLRNYGQLYMGDEIPTRQLAQPAIKQADHLYFCHRAGVTASSTTMSQHDVA